MAPGFEWGTMMSRRNLTRCTKLYIVALVMIGALSLPTGSVGAGGEIIYRPSVEFRSQLLERPMTPEDQKNREAVARAFRSSPLEAPNLSRAMGVWSQVPSRLSPPVIAPIDWWSSRNLRGERNLQMFEDYFKVRVPELSSHPDAK